MKLTLEQLLEVTRDLIRTEEATNDSTSCDYGCLYMLAGSIDTGLDYCDHLDYEVEL